MSEILTAIKLIKCYAWEDHYESKVSNARRIEIQRLAESLTYKIANFVVVFIAPVVVTLIALATWETFHGAKMDAVVTFTALSLFNTLRYPLLMLPNAVRTIQGN